MSDDGDSLVGRLIAVADGTDADQRLLHRCFDAGQIRMVIDDPGRQQDGAGANAAAIDLSDESVAVLGQAPDAPRFDDRAIFLGLFAHPLQDVGAGDAGRKARHIVAERNPAGAGRAAIHHQGPPTKSPLIGHRVRQVTDQRSDGTPAHSPITLSCVRVKPCPVQAQVCAAPQSPMPRALAKADRVRVLGS